MKGNVFSRSMLALGLAHSAFLYAGEFYTIIAPDGRPMVVQQHSQPRKTAQSEQPKPTSAALQQPVQSIQAAAPSAFGPVSSVQQLTVVDENLGTAVKNTPTNLSAKTEQHTSVIPPKPVKEPRAQAVSIKSKLESVTVKAAIPITVVQSKQSEIVEDFVMVDGEKYIKNEYLEDKEFNLEGKKRFYAMPEGIIDRKNGATRLQLIEREKGVSKSVLQSFFNRNQNQDTGPIVLASTYYRISQAEAIQSLGQSCIANKKMKQVKTLKIDKEVNLWPRAPLKEQFDFEVVQLSAHIQNIHIYSYASKQNAASFYWPFIVFLDHQGCVLEGAGGFKNQQSASSFATHENIEGIIHIPSQSQYVLFTPLASAIDVEDKVLSNQGQLKLIAIR